MSDLQKSMKFFKVGKLRDIAAMRVAIQLLYHPKIQKMIEICYTKTESGSICNFWNYTIFNEVRNLANALKEYTPKVTVTLIVAFVDKLCTYSRSWIIQLDKFIFKTQYDKNYTAFRYMGSICWAPDGTVDEFATAEVMLRDSSITDVQKFRIMASYCMVDRLQAISLSEFKERYFEEIQLFEQPLQYFWNSYYVDEHFESRDYFDLIKKSNSNDYFCEDSRFFDVNALRNVINLGEPCFTDYFFVSYVYLPDVHAVSYFWDRVNDLTRTMILVGLGPNCGADILWGLMAKMSAKQLNQLVDTYLYTVVQLFQEMPFYEDRALTVAALSTPKQFAEIVYNFIHGVEAYAICPILFVAKLWNLVSAEHKSFLFHHYEGSWAVAPLAASRRCFCICSERKHMYNMIYLFTHDVDVEYKWIQKMFFRINWNSKQFKRFKKYALQLDEFISLVLLPHDAEVVRSECPFLQ